MINDFTNRLISKLFVMLTGENRSGNDHCGDQDAVRDETRVSTRPVGKDRVPIS